MELQQIIILAVLIIAVLTVIKFFTKLIFKLIFIALILGAFYYFARNFGLI